MRKAPQMPPNPRLLAGGATLHQAETIAGLADMTRLSRNGFVGTVAGYNDAVHSGRLAALSLPATRSGQSRTIETPPFFVIPICAGTTGTMGGVAVTAA